MITEFSLAVTMVTMNRKEVEFLQSSAGQTLTTHRNQHKQLQLAEDCVCVCVFFMFMWTISSCLKPFIEDISALRGHSDWSWLQRGCLGLCVCLSVCLHFFCSDLLAW